MASSRLCATLGIFVQPYILLLAHSTCAEFLAPDTPAAAPIAPGRRSGAVLAVRARALIGRLNARCILPSPLPQLSRGPAGVGDQSALSVSIATAGDLADGLRHVIVTRAGRGRPLPHGATATGLAAHGRGYPQMPVTRSLRSQSPVIFERR